MRAQNLGLSGPCANLMVDPQQSFGFTDACPARDDAPRLPFPGHLASASGSGSKTELGLGPMSRGSLGGSVPHRATTRMKTLVTESPWCLEAFFGLAGAQIMSLRTLSDIGRM